jgi:FAD binding domain
MTIATDPPHWVVLSGLRERLKGLVALPGDAGYGIALPWNRAVAVEPVAVVIAEDADDVVAAVRFAGEHHFRVAVQATGHGAVPLGPDVLLVHTARLDEVTVDPERRTARVGAGVVWQRVIDAAATHGLTPVAGSATSVGVVGHLTGGGIGPLVSTYGVSSDHVRAFDVVTGDGRRRHVTPTEDADLFWGLRGGKSTLGIVTAVKIDLLPHNEIYGGALYFDDADTSAVLHTWATWSAFLPEEATTSVALLRLPAEPDIPAPIAGRRVVAVRFATVADEQRAEALLAPIRAVSTPIFDGVGVLPCTRIAAVHADPQGPAPILEHTALLRALPVEAVDAILAVAGPRSDTPLLSVELRRLGGAFARPGRHPSAFCHRGAAYQFAVVGLAIPPERDAVAAHAQGVVAAAEPWSTGGRLANFAPSADPARIAMAYDENTRHRLATLARRYDPDGTLSTGQAVVTTAQD